MVLEPGASLDVDAIRAHCKSSLAGYKVPREFVELDELPANPMGKVLRKKVAEAMAQAFRDSGVTKILTIESSGIAIATAVGLELGVPVMFAKKHKSSNVDGAVYTAEVYSYTHNTSYTILVSSDYLKSTDTVLLVDDFLANGKALNGLTELVEQAGARLAGAAIAIEKGFQGGGDALRAKGVRVESMAVIDAMTDDAIVFRS